MPNINGDNSEYFREGINTTEIEDLNYTSKIDLSLPNVIDFESANVQINGVDILTGATGLANPLTANLDGGAFSITNVQNVESVTRTENGINGELVKIVSTNTYAGTSAGNNGSSTGNTSYGNNVLSAVAGTSNSGYGQACLQNNTTGTYNCGFGKVALQDNLMGNFNNAFGYGTFLKNIASNNTGFGHTAGLNTTTGTNDVYIGCRNNDSGNFDDCTSIGASCQNGGNNSTTIGSGTTGTKANQCMICNNTVTEIVPMSNGLCDLGSSTNKFKDGYIGGNLEVSSINSITPAGGLFLATGAGVAVTNTIVESNLIGSMPIVGSLSIPANTFEVSSYNLNISGNFASKNGDTITIRFYAGPLASTLLDTMVVPMAGTTGSSFELETDFDIQMIGIAGSAQIAINKELTYQDSGLSIIKGFRVATTNNTTFDTTVLNFLNVTVQYSAADVGNSIQATRAVLTKVY